MAEPNSAVEQFRLAVEGAREILQKEEFLLETPAATAIASS
jgi:hypothetical protein